MTYLVQYIPRNMHTVLALLCFVMVIHWLICPYPSGLLHWHCGNLTIAPVPAKQPWWTWINTSCEFIMNDCITTTKQSTTKPCAYFLGYTVVWLGQWLTQILCCLLFALWVHYRHAAVKIDVKHIDEIKFVRCVDKIQYRDGYLTRDLILPKFITMMSIIVDTWQCGSRTLVTNGNRSRNPALGYVSGKKHNVLLWYLNLKYPALCKLRITYFGNLWRGLLHRKNAIASWIGIMTSVAVGDNWSRNT